MSAFILWLFEIVGGAALKRWWGGSKDPEVEGLKDALKAKDEEAKTLAAPPMGKSATVLSMQQRLDDTRH